MSVFSVLFPGSIRFYVRFEDLVLLLLYVVNFQLITKWSQLPHRSLRGDTNLLKILYAEQAVRLFPVCTHNKYVACA